METHNFPFPGSSYRGPAPIFARLRAEQPVVRVAMRGGRHAWLVTRHADVCSALTNPQLSRAASYGPSAPQFEGLFQAPPDMIISLDPPDHTRLRALTARAFSVERIEEMRPSVDRLVTRLLDDLEHAATGEPVDLLATFAEPLALGTICELLGVPGEDQAVFAQWIRQVAAVAGSEEASIHAREQLGGYMAGLVAAKIDVPGDDVLSALIAARDGDDRLSHGELVGLGYTLLGAGADSSASQLANSVLTLVTDHRDVWRRLGEHPDEVPAAVEELLRGVNLLADDTSGLPRIALTDVRIGDTVVPAGDAVFVAIASANHDDAVFDSADELSFARPDNAHLSFGHGIHHCLGAPLARLELTIALRELTRRFPRARLAVPESQLEWNLSDVNHRLVSLPVAVGTAAG